ncbi:MAG: hypothetical protein Q6353_010935 [Candidatus Sigynarchaeum springense]
MSLTPTSRGYGTSFANAEVITPGTISEPFNPSYWDAYFKISCGTGNVLKVGLTFNTASNDFELRLYDPNQVFITEDESGASRTSLHVQTMCRSSGYYFIRIWENGSGTDTIVLTVELTSSIVSGFDTMTIIVSIMLAIGIAWYFVSKRSRPA